MPRRVTGLMRHDRKALAGWQALVGVDEAGRGALFGPVHAAAVLVSERFLESAWFRKEAHRVNDSKRLSPKERSLLADEIRELGLDRLVVSCVSSANVAEIEERNILGATQLAMTRAITGALSVAGFDLNPAHGLLGSGTSRPAVDVCRILIDGKPLRQVPFSHEALVGGDGRSLVIAMASILAKQERDREMGRLAELYPGYGLEEHMGYATPAHREAIIRLGPTHQHRDLFLRKLMAGAALEDPHQAELDLNLP